MVGLVVVVGWRVVGAVILLLFLWAVIITIWFFGELGTLVLLGVGLRAVNGGAGGNVQQATANARATMVPT